MSFKIDPALKVGIGAPSAVLNLSIAKDIDKLSLVGKLNGGPPDDANDAAVLTDPIEVGRETTLSIASQGTDTAVSALKAVEDQRQLQLDLATEAKGLPEVTGRLSTLSTEFNTIQTEISRITQAASFNGQNALTSGSTTQYTLDTISKEASDAVFIGPSTDITGSLTYSFSTASNALTAETTVKQNLTALRGFTDGAESARNKADTIVPDDKRNYLIPDPEPNQLQELSGSSPQIDYERQADRVAKQVTQDLQNSYNEDEQRLKLTKLLTEA